MAVKLVVHRFEEGVNFKTLLITINQNDTDIPLVKYGEWSEWKKEDNKRESTKPRLVIKLVSGNNIDYFNLASCAKEIHNCDTFYNWNNSISYLNAVNHLTPKENLSNSNNIHDVSKDNAYADPDKDIIFRAQGYNTDNRNTAANPLEYSIEKVKENNARIMENIHMLNRTLNYTKKKEILDIICPKPMRSYPCEACGKCFVYETGLKRHYATRHSVTELYPRWQVVWTCTECFQVWPRHDIALTHTTLCCRKESSDCIREIKTSSLLQCEFCEQVFTNIPRLLRHSKTHTVAKNYECKPCNLAFISYRNAEQHWMSCSRLNICYKFSLPKMLLCNVCDRKFKNYDQLYNHRYKVGHFIAKSHIESNSISLMILVYQCEVCGQWFHVVQALLIHKNQDHPRLHGGL